MRGKKKTWGTRGNQTYGAYSNFTHSALDSHYHTTEQDISTSTEHDLTALCTALTTCQEALDQPWLRLAARQEAIEGTDERAREVQRAVEYCQKAVGKREAIGQRGLYFTLPHRFHMDSTWTP